MSNTNFSREEFQKYLNDHKLMGTTCKNCGETFLPPRPICAKCGSNEMEWIPVSEKGTLTAFTIVYIAPTAMINAGYGRDNPYCSGIVSLENGLSISAQILGMDVTHPENIRVGIPLKVSFLERGEDESKKTFLAFEPV